jgi:hypothetical protein
MNEVSTIKSILGSRLQTLNTLQESSNSVQFRQRIDVFFKVRQAIIDIAVIRLSAEAEDRAQNYVHSMGGFSFQ